MEIIDNRIAPMKIQFDELDVGDIFESDSGIVFMKIDSGTKFASHNAVSLSTGYVDNLEYDTYVMPLKCKLIII